MATEKCQSQGGLRKGNILSIGESESWDNECMQNKNRKLKKLKILLKKKMKLQYKII